jgi:hypothetical protein
VVEPSDRWPSLPAVDLAEPEPWRDLERQRVRDERIAREQVGR